MDRSLGIRSVGQDSGPAVVNEVHTTPDRVPRLPVKTKSGHGQDSQDSLKGAFTWL